MQLHVEVLGSIPSARRKEAREEGREERKKEEGREGKKEAGRRVLRKLHIQKEYAKE